MLRIIETTGRRKVHCTPNESGKPRLRPHILRGHAESPAAPVGRSEGVRLQGGRCETFGHFLCNFAATRRTADSLSPGDGPDRWPTRNFWTTISSRGFGVTNPVSCRRHCSIPYPHDGLPARRHLTGQRCHSGAAASCARNFARCQRRQAPDERTSSCHSLSGVRQASSSMSNRFLFFRVRSSL
jgi:hypothetical protein